MGAITLPYSMEQDRINQVKANSVHIDDNFNTLVNAVNGKLDADGSTTATNNLPMGGYKVVNLGAPTSSGDAATKGYVDSAITAAKVVATTSRLGQVIIGNNISVDASGKISVATASNAGSTGVVQLGKTDTVSNASQALVRKTVITNTVPSSGTDGVIYFVYAQ